MCSSDLSVPTIALWSAGGQISVRGYSKSMALFHVKVCKSGGLIFINARKKAAGTAYDDGSFAKFPGNSRRENSARHPTRGSLIFSPVRNLAFLAAGNKLKNNQPAPIQTSLAMILGGRQDQPVTRQDFIGPALAQDLIAAIQIQFQRRGGTRLGLSCDFDLCAIISSGKISIPACWQHKQGQRDRSQENNPRYVKNRFAAIRHGWS